MYSNALMTEHYNMALSRFMHNTASPWDNIQHPPVPAAPFSQWPALERLQSSAPGV